MSQYRVVKSPRYRFGYFVQRNSTNDGPNVNWYSVEYCYTKWGAIWEAKKRYKDDQLAEAKPVQIWGPYP